MATSSIKAIPSEDIKLEQNVPCGKFVDTCNNEYPLSRWAVQKNNVTLTNNEAIIPTSFNGSQLVDIYGRAIVTIAGTDYDLPLFFSDNVNSFSAYMKSTETGIHIKFMSNNVSAIRDLLLIVVHS